MLCVLIRIASLRRFYRVHTIYRFQYIKKKITLNFPNLQQMDYFLGTQERVRNSRCKRAISVRAIEVLLILCKLCRPDKTPRMIWFCTVCLCLFHGALGINGLIFLVHIHWIHLSKAHLLKYPLIEKNIVRTLGAVVV